MRCNLKAGTARYGVSSRYGQVRPYLTVPATTRYGQVRVDMSPGYGVVPQRKDHVMPKPEGVGGGRPQDAAHPGSQAAKDARDVARAEKLANKPEEVDEAPEEVGGGEATPEESA